VPCFASESKRNLADGLATDALQQELDHGALRLISGCQNAMREFDLLGGTRIEQAKKVADLLNEYVLDVFVTTRQDRNHIISRNTPSDETPRALKTTPPADDNSNVLVTRLAKECCFGSSEQISQVIHDFEDSSA
jgi:hypothetical protein